MVSTNTSNVTGDIAGATRSDRGLITEETTSSVAPLSGYSSTSSMPGHSHRFWPSVIAGSLVTFSIFVLSMALMLGCGVGVSSTSHLLSFGWGAAIWIVITSCIAYFFGGMVSGSMDSAGCFSSTRAFTMWGLSVPLVMVIGAFVAGATGLLYGFNSAHLTEQVTNQTGAAYLQQGNLFINYGGAWTAFLSLLGGLCFSVIGALSALNDRTSARASNVVTS
jgi:hypothetical protein